MLLSTNYQLISADEGDKSTCFISVNEHSPPLAGKRPLCRAFRERVDNVVLAMGKNVKAVKDRN